MFSLNAKVCSRKLRTAAGYLLWVTWIAPHMKPWMSAFYRALDTPGKVPKQLDTDMLQEVYAALDASCMTTAAVVSCDVLPGWRLVRVGKHEVCERGDLLRPARKQGLATCEFL